MVPGILTVIITIAILLPVSLLAAGPSLVALIRQHHELRQQRRSGLEEVVAGAERLLLEVD